MYGLGKSSPTTPTSFTGAKKLAATAAWLAEPPRSFGFSALGVLMESRAVEPTIRTLMVFANWNYDGSGSVWRAEIRRSLKDWQASRIFGALRMAETTQIRRAPAC